MRSLISLVVATLITAVAGVSPLSTQEYPGAGDGRMYIGTFSEAIYVLSERTGEVTDRIPLSTGIPRYAILNEDGNRIYVVNVDRERVEIVDIATKETLDVFSMSEGTEKVRIWGYVVNPAETRAVFVVRSYERLVDRWNVRELHLLVYDLDNHQVLQELPWPDGEPDFFPSMEFSPDGRFFYFFMDEVRIYETDNFTEVDRWDYARSVDTGLGRLGFGFPSSPYEEEGHYTGLFRMEDPVSERDLMGIAQVDLDERRIEFFTLGPSASVRFTLGPEDRAYGLHTEIGNYQLWTFDLENRSVTDRKRIQGRPRMRLEASSNGEYLYVWQAGPTIDLLDPESGEYVYTIELDADTTTDLIVVPGGGAG